MKLGKDQRIRVIISMGKRASKKGRRIIIGIGIGMGMDSAYPMFSWNGVSAPQSPNSFVTHAHANALPNFQPVVVVAYAIMLVLCTATCIHLKFFVSSISSMKGGFICHRLASATLQPYQVSYAPQTLYVLESTVYCLVLSKVSVSIVVVGMQAPGGGWLFREIDESISP